jgi:hypothetical protein
MWKYKYLYAAVEAIFSTSVPQILKIGNFGMLASEMQTDC